MHQGQSLQKAMLFSSVPLNIPKQVQNTISTTWNKKNWQIPLGKNGYRIKSTFLRLLPPQSPQSLFLQHLTIIPIK